MKAFLSNPQVLSLLNEYEEDSSLSLSLSWLDVLRRYGDCLNELEKEEVKSYASIFYFGWKCLEKRCRRSRAAYVDENGFYAWLKGDHLSYRYEVLEVLGQGSFGVVLHCFDHQMKENVACKIIRKKKRFEEQALIERNLLEHLIQFDNEHQFNVIHLKHSFTFRSHFILSLELLGSEMNTQRSTNLLSLLFLELIFIN